MIMLRRRNLIFLIIITLIIGALISGGLFLFLDKNLGKSVIVSKDDYDTLTAMTEKYLKLESMYQYVSDNFYLPVKEEDLENGMYKGLVGGLGDPYSSYLTASEYDEMMTGVSGEYDGIGLTLAVGSDGYVTVVAPMDGSPAYEAGIKAGDKIIKVNGKNYNNETFNEVAVALRGKSGTKVKFTVSRDGKNIEHSLTRSNIVLETVLSKMLDENIGYIRVSSFEENTAKTFKTELREMEVKGADGLIVDLRDNGGGLMMSGVEIADMLLPAGIITYTEDRKGNRESYKSDASYTDLPYVVLINEGSASASEIVAAAVKDHEAGKLVGTKTFGKGIIQGINLLEDKTAIKLTFSHYFSPNNDIIHDVGVTPDVIIEQVGDEEVDEQLEKALSLLSLD